MDIQFGLMRWSCRDGAKALGVSETKWTQAIEPAFRKIITLFLEDDMKTMVTFAYYLDMVRQERFNQRLAELEREKEGRADLARANNDCGIEERTSSLGS